MRIASLYLETAYSFGGSNITLEPLFEKAVKEGYRTLVLTDSKMHAAYRFHQGCREKGIDPVIGLQVRLEPLFEGSHILLLCYAKNMDGYRNLLKMSSLQSVNTTLTFAQLKTTAEHVSVVLPAHAGEFSVTTGDETRRRAIIHEIKQVAPRLYLGEHPDFPFGEEASDRVPIDYVAYMEQGQQVLYERLRTLLKPADEDGLPAIIDAHVKPIAHFTRYSDAQRSALETFLKEHTFSLSEEPPSLPTFPDTRGMDSFGYLTNLSKAGLKKRLTGLDQDEAPYRKRLDEELKTIGELGYADYFLIVWDIVRAARKEKVLVGPGRGSAPGSLVAYALGITHVDPLAFNLVFERFLNKARSSMPDIDIDFPDHARESIIRYVIERYGEAYVSLICTFGTFLKKSALRESARLFAVDKQHVEEAARKLEHHSSVAAMIDKDADVKNRMAQSDDLAAWLSTAAAIEGLPKHVSTHAAGIVITAKPITEYSAVQKGVGNHHQTQYEQEDLENMGLLKIDVLGLRNLAMIEDVLALIRQNERLDISPYKLSLEDKDTFALLREGSTTGIFQLESPGMRKLVKALKIRRFEDIVTALALFRPGPMQSIDTYLARREHREKTTVIAAELAPILSPTEGILLYQEQIMAIAVRFANYTMVEADLLRRAVSKKDESVLLNERRRFVEKAVQAGKNKKDADRIYDFIVTFANYGFNRSHSVAYAVIAYWMAYLKAHYPACFIAVLLESALGNAALLKEYRREAAQLGIRLAAPNVNHSATRFARVDDTLYIPLSGIRNIGKAVANGIVQARGDGVFASFQDFVLQTRSIVNRRHLDALAVAGALDGFNRPRKEMIENTDALLHYFDYADEHDLDGFVFSETGEYSKSELLQMQKEALGFTMAGIDFDRAAADFHKQVTRLADMDTNTRTASAAWVVAHVSQTREIMTKNGDAMAFLTLEDDFTVIEAVCFPTQYERYKDILSPGQIVFVYGHMDKKNNRLQFIVKDVAKP